MAHFASISLLKLILRKHEPSTSLYRLGGLELEEPNTNEMRAKFKVLAHVKSGTYFQPM